MLLDSGQIKCWGLGTSGQLGNGSTSSSTTPVFVSGISTATAIAAGLAHTCALLSNNTVQCWGSDADTQLGDGQSTNQSTPVVVSGISTATKITVGSYHSCALLANSTIACWGLNSTGQLGNNTLVSTSSGTPTVAVNTINSAIQISAGSAHTCAVLSGGAVDCWGLNTSGQLGLGNNNVTNQPAAIQNNQGGYTQNNVTLIAAGGSHTCAILSSHAVACWGLNTSGQLGNTSTTTSNKAVAVSTMATADGISAGNNHTCASTSGNTVFCWGDGSTGQMGNGARSSQDAEVQVTSLTTSATLGVTSGGDHSCTLLTSGAVDCWGDDGDGQLGDGNSSTNLDNFAAVVGL